MEEVIQLPPRASYSKVVALPLYGYMYMLGCLYQLLLPPVFASRNPHQKSCYFLSSVNQSCPEIMQKRTVLWLVIVMTSQNYHKIHTRPQDCIYIMYSCKDFSQTCVMSLFIEQWGESTAGISAWCLRLGDVDLRDRFQFRVSHKGHKYKFLRSAVEVNVF